MFWFLYKLHLLPKYLLKQNNCLKLPTAWLAHPFSSYLCTYSINRQTCSSCCMTALLALATQRQEKRMCTQTFVNPVSLQIYVILLLEQVQIGHCKQGASESVAATSWWLCRAGEWNGEFSQKWFGLVSLLPTVIYYS